jgi:tetratricopeptide (TPR) repeat protein
MRHFACVALFLLACPIALAQMGHHHTATLLPGDGLRISPCVKLDTFAAAVSQPQFQQAAWTVKGVTPEAQAFFNQGMTQYWGFNYEEAMRNFKAAAAANKPSGQMAMASWGLALAAGPNINLGMDQECHALAKAESAKALKLASQPGAEIAPEQLGVIKALPLRYEFPATPEGKAVDPGTKAAAEKAQVQYSDAMARVWQEANDEPNVGALYAESMVELHPWALFKSDGRPETGAPVALIFDALARSIAKAPDTVGANHYWIHVAEASPTPSTSLNSANLLQERVKQSGHLVHMSSHIYLRMGNYQQSLAANEKGVDNDVMNDKDHSGYGVACSGGYARYSADMTCPQLYYGHYLSHNYFFGSVSATFAGQSEEAMKLACATRAHVERFVIYEPGLQRYMTAPLMTMVVNRNWDRIIAETEAPEPDFHECYLQPPFGKDSGSGCHILRSVYYWARGMALAARGRVADARMAYQRLEKERGMARVNPPETWGNNDAWNMLGIGAMILNARVYWADKAEETTFSSLGQAAQTEDDLRYDEPPQWFTPVREALGGSYLRAGRYDDAIKTFKEELERHPASGRALYGLTRALQERAPQLAKKDEQNAMASEADEVKKEFCSAWRDADYTMADDDLWPASGLNTNKGGGGITCSSTKRANPSQCTCPALTVWPPSAGTRDLAINELQCAK